MSRPLVALLVGLLALLRRARSTRPDPLPPAPAGSTTVLTGDGTRLHAEVGGQADAPVTVVLVHGFLARTLAFDLQWQHLGARARLVRYDHRNHGRSGSTRRTIDVHTLADDLACVVAQLAPRGPVVLVGHSMGGMTCLALALRHPALFRSRVAAVALLATGAGHYLPGRPFENAARWASRRHAFAGGLLLFRLLAPLLELVRPRRTRTMRWVTKQVMFGGADLDPATLGMTQDLLEGPRLATFGSLQGALLRHDVLDALPLLREVPVTVVAGADDRLTRAEHSARMVQEIGPSAELVLLPGAGHLVNQTRPTEVNAALDALLDRAVPALALHGAAQGLAG